MNTQFTASESVNIQVTEESVPIRHYLRQPQRLVKAIANPNLMEQLSEERFHLKMRPIDFMMYHFQPTVILHVWTDPDGTVHLNSEDCEIRGIEYINERFSLKVQGKLSPQDKNGATVLVGRADLEVNVELAPPLQLTPPYLLETTGNGLLKSVLQRIKQRLSNQLLTDYRQWANSNNKSESADKTSSLSPAENPTI